MLRKVTFGKARFCMALALCGFCAAALARADDEKKEPEKKVPEKKERVAPGLPGLEFDFPNFDELFKGLPLDPAQAKMLREQMEKAREQWKRALEDLGKGGGKGLPLPGGFPPLPGGLPLPGGFPLPGGDPLPGGLPFPLPGLPGFERPMGEGRLGVEIEPPSETLSDHLGLRENQGVVVRAIRAESAAAKGGLKPHDIILEWGGKAVTSDPAAFKAMVDAAGVEPADVKVMRKGKVETLRGIALPERKDARPAPRPRIDVRAPGGERFLLGSGA